MCVPVSFLWKLWICGLMVVLTTMCIYLPGYNFISLAAFDLHIWHTTCIKSHYRDFKWGITTTDLSTIPVKDQKHRMIILHDRLYVTKSDSKNSSFGFAKRDLHTHPIYQVLMIFNFRLVEDTDLKFGQQEAPT